MALYTFHYYVWNGSAFSVQSNKPTSNVKYYLRCKLKDRPDWQEVWYVNNGNIKGRFCEMPINIMDLPKEVVLFMELEK